MKKNNIRCSIAILLGVGIDLVSKYFFYTLEYLRDINLIHPVLNLGISRSLPVPFFIIIFVSIVGIIAFVRLFVQKKFNRITAAFLIAGTAGNLIDRIVFGGVRDFINIGIFNFPVFNFADIMLTIGVVLRILVVMLEKKK